MSEPVVEPSYMEFEYGNALNLDHDEGNLILGNRDIGFNNEPSDSKESNFIQIIIYR